MIDLYMMPLEDTELRQSFFSDILKKKFGINWTNIHVTLTVYPLLGLLFSSSLRPNRFWGPHSLVSSGYRGLVPRSKVAEVSI
jgi:hypothetical protein